ncbi:hypothetical protein B0J15DRAFT_556888 [Fusarium solani]|uniref:Uncharacterized protein n=1 Tax=Fusarium solani TaxID=169388 RepID=A0A9P9L6T5_FUSSL|nr:uncharacterized protein B0J15DRAFT_556888 [Fusarium solani]KAH7274998.1 hypothetical protein B0J15DRAFT_556888 [Fusarium solani]
MKKHLEKPHNLIPRSLDKNDGAPNGKHPLVVGCEDAGCVLIQAVASPASDELNITKTTAKEVVSQLPSGTFITDLGAADSMKFEPYDRETQGKECTYVPLDLSAGPYRPEGQVRDQEAFNGASRSLGQLFVSLLSSLA